MLPQTLTDLISKHERKDGERSLLVKAHVQDAITLRAISHSTKKMTTLESVLLRQSCVLIKHKHELQQHAVVEHHSSVNLIGRTVWLFA